ncbi:hypothetical protein [Halopseudomonas bauzanensis]|uniref:hypothetical protein n=1 Tax=Halopseudomonas bauzanensis TaxID=653930 RepID=UPI002554AE42|nr:hypothetical protein [Halopseudomonas bauzanensis]
MSEDDIEDDDLQDEEVDNSDVDESDAMENDDEPAVKPRKKVANQEDPLEGLSLEAKAREREMLARQMEEFLSRGGKVQEVDNNALADPPKKPEGKYGSRPI